MQDGRKATSSDAADEWADQGADGGSGTLDGTMGDTVYSNESFFHRSWEGGPLHVGTDS